MISLRNMVKRYTISVSEFSECLAATLNHQCSSEVVSAVSPILMSEFIYCLISPEPNLRGVEVEETAHALFALDFSIEQFIKIKAAFYNFYLIRHVCAVDAIVAQWREHCDVEMSWGLSADGSVISILFAPKPNHIDIDALVEEAILKCVNDGKFIPYKYLRTVGRL